MNEYNASSLFYTIALLISIARGANKLRTFLYSIAAFMIASFVVLLSLFFLPAINAGVLGHLAGDTGRMAGAITAFVYSTKTRERAPKSVYLIAVTYTIASLAGLALECF